MDGVFSVGIRGPRRGFIPVQLMHSVIAFGAGGVVRFLRFLVDAIDVGWRTIFIAKGLSLFFTTTSICTFEALELGAVARSQEKLGQRP